MARISFTKGQPPIDVQSDSNLMQSLLDAQRPVASSCGGDGVCVKCRIKIVEGRENLSPETEREKDLREIHEIPKNERISCQTKVLGDITVDAPYW